MKTKPNEESWYKGHQERMISRALTRETINGMLHAMSKLHAEHAKTLDTGRVSALEMIVNHPDKMRNSGFEYLMDLGHTRGPVPQLTQYLSPISGGEIFDHLTQFLELSRLDQEEILRIVLTRQLDNSMNGMDGRVSTIKNVRPQDLINNVFVQDHEQKTVSRRRVIPLPGLTMGTCECCLTNNTIALMSSLRSHLPEGEIPRKVLQERSDKLFGQQLMSTHNKQIVKSLRLLSNQLDAHDEASLGEMNIASVLRPTSEAVLISLLCFRIGSNGLANYSVRLTCQKCFDGLQDPKTAYVRLRNAEFVESYLNNLGKPKEMYQIRRLLEDEAKKFRQQIVVARNNTRKHIDHGVEKPILSSNELHEEEMSELCNELLRVGLDAMVSKGKYGKLVLKRTVKLSEARQALQDVKSADELFTTDTPMVNIIGKQPRPQPGIPDIKELTVPSLKKLLKDAGIKHGFKYKRDLYNCYVEHLHTGVQ